MLGNLFRNGTKAIKALATRRVELECDRIPFRFENVPYGKILNWIRVEASMHVKPDRPWGWPTHMQVEPTNCCNLKCALCPVTEGLERESGMMDMDVFRKIVDEGGKHVFLMLLWEWGEPFLHPQAYEMIAYARKNGIKVISSSNGHRFTRPGEAEKLVRSGIDGIIVATDGISQDTYDRYRRSGKLETVLDGIRAIVAAKKKLNSQTPLVNFRFIVMKHNEHEIPRLEEFARSLGVDALSLKTLYPGHGVDPSMDQENEFVPTDPRYQRFRYDENKNRIGVGQNPCKGLWNAPAIHWNGVICTCSFDVNENCTFGDLTKSSFEECWRGDAYAAMRRQFRENWSDIHLCGGCSYAYEGGSCATETIADVTFLTPGLGPTEPHAG